MFNRIIRLIIKEFRVVWGDKKSRLVLIVPPIIQLLVLSFAATYEVRNNSLGIYLEDRGTMGREFVSRLVAMKETFSDVRFYHSQEDVTNAIELQETICVAHIGQRFSAEIESGQTATIQLILDGRKANAAFIIQGYLNRVSREFSNEISKEANKDILVSRIWFNENLNPLWSTVPALLGILINLIALIITSLSIARERELGTFEQLLVSPLRPIEILFGKMIPSVLIGLIEGVALIAIVVIFFRIPITGSPLVLFLAMVIFLFSIVGVGLFISSLAKTQQQGFLGAFTYFVPAVLLSGFVSPIENIPYSLRILAYINPLRYIILISRNVFLEDPLTSDVIKMTLPLIPIALFTLIAAAALFKKRTQ